MVLNIDFVLTLEVRLAHHLFGSWTFWQRQPGSGLNYNGTSVNLHKNL